MRIEVVLSDNTAEARILKSVPDPLAYVLQLVRADNGASAPNLSAATPDYVAILASADGSPNRFRTREEVDQYVKGLRSEW